MKENEVKKLNAALRGIGVQDHLRNHLILEIQSETASEDVCHQLGLHFQEFMRETIKQKLMADQVMMSAYNADDELLDYRAAVDALRKKESGET